MDGPRILLTNDDGIDAVGIRALYDALTEVGDIVAVAPADDQSAVGRRMSYDVEVIEHELGYAVEGTPADCVVAGLEALCPDVDLVVSGCNKGANLSAYVLGRSGTVSAAVEATFFDVPAMAVSLYVPGGDWHAKATEPEEFREATDAAAYLADEALDAGVFERADYLNVNAPLPGEEPAEMVVTRPSRFYEMTAERQGSRLRLNEHLWKRLNQGTIPDEEGTDARAIVDDRVSVSPLTAPHTTHHHDELDAIAGRYRT